MENTKQRCVSDPLGGLVVKRWPSAETSRFDSLFFFQGILFVSRKKKCRHIKSACSLSLPFFSLALSGQTGKADSSPERAVLDSQRARQQKNNEAIVAVSKFLTLKPFLEE